MKTIPGVLKTCTGTQNVTWEDKHILRGVQVNLYWEEIFNETFEKGDRGIKPNGISITILSYVDDSVLIANGIEEMQKM